MAILELSDLGKSFGSTVAVAGVTLAVATGELIGILGPSGCGKTTTLRIVAGFVVPTAGRVVLNGRDITRISANKRDIGMVFQNYALFPHMNVRRNVEFGLVSHKMRRSSLGRLVDETLSLVGLTEFGERYPRELSGGQQQRVALARVLALRPQLLLFDEPLSSLDAKLRVQMRQEIRRLQKAVGIAGLFVTHDQEEAMAIADRVVVMNKGRIEQVGLPAEVYDHPKTRFVAEFIGTSNLLDGVVVGSSDGRIRVRTLGDQEFVVHGSAAAGTAGTLCVRPEMVDLSAGGLGDLPRGSVRQVSRNGPIVEYEVELAGGASLKSHRYVRGDMTVLSEGEEVALAIDGESMTFIAE